MQEFIYHTGDNYPGVIIRLTLGIVILAHGCRKMLGVFGGPGFDATMEYLTKTAKVPLLLAVFIIFTEFCGSIFLLLGLGTKLWAICMIGDILLTVTFGKLLKAGFFMNWDGGKNGEGFEYHLLAIGMAMTLLITGAGKYSIDLYYYN